MVTFFIIAIECCGIGITLHLILFLQAADAVRVTALFTQPLIGDVFIAGTPKRVSSRILQCHYQSVSATGFIFL